MIVLRQGETDVARSDQDMRWLLSGNNEGDVSLVDSVSTNPQIMVTSSILSDSELVAVDQAKFPLLAATLNKNTSPTPTESDELVDWAALRASRSPVMGAPKHEPGAFEQVECPECRTHYCSCDDCLITHVISCGLSQAPGGPMQGAFEVIDLEV